MKMLADLGPEISAAIAALAGIVVTTIFNGLVSIFKSSISMPDRMKKVEDQIVLDDGRIKKLFEKTDALERDVLLLKHRPEE
jgi:hypothetical protein